MIGKSGRGVRTDWDRFVRRGECGSGRWSGRYIL